ncbi:hypothetical protein GCM10027064_01640 [Microbacterium petrolearium]
MTSTPEPPTRKTLSRRETRALVARAVAEPSRPAAAWTAKRAVASVIAGAAAVGFLASYLAPTVAAMAEPGEDDVTTAYAETVADAQIFNSPAKLEANALGSVDYEIYVTPTPTPTPTPTAASAALPDVASILGPPPYTGGGSKEEWMAAAGIPQADWPYVDSIVSRESGWNPNATNSSSGACGLVQVYPCGKLANAYDPVVNLTWANGYANKYGGWAGAYAFWQSNHWW